MKKTTTLLALSLVSIALFLAGCATVKGLGQDLQTVGEKIEDSVKKK